MDDFSSMRYAHSDGHTDICFDKTGKTLVTCGTDGDIRIWKGFEDEDPQSQNMGNIVTAVALKNEFLYVATDVFTVTAYTFPDIEFDSIVAQYNSPIHHIVCSGDGELVASGGGDFVIKVYDVLSKKLTAFRGHEGSILSLAFDPREKYLASSGCDGTVRFWQIADQECIKSLNILKKRNDVSTSSSLHRLSWSPDGQFIAIPVEDEVRLYQRNTWDCAYSLSDSSITESVSISLFSPFGNYVAASTINGQLVVWDVEKKSCVSRKSHEKKVAITSFVWNPSGKDIAFCDAEGQLGIYEKPLTLSHSQVSKVDKSDVPIDFECDVDEKGDDDDANDLDLFYDNEDNDAENAFDIGAIKASLEPKIFGEDDALENGSIKSEKPEPKVQVVEAPKPVVQTSFQPSSTPVHLEQRFMLWNSVGIVRSYNTEEENSIDVEFHDVNVYHPLHLNNTRNHTLAALSSEALLLACQKGEESSSKLECMHFGTWDSNKEWIVEVPETEDIECISLGEGFAVCVTDKRYLRIFTISGVLCEVLSIPGPVVCCSARDKLIAIAYHKGLGIENDQCMGLMVVDVKLGGHCVIRDYPLPLSPKSFLSWLGFTDEGFPCIVDTAGIINLLTTNFGMKWTPIADTRKNINSVSSTYFVIGLSEIKQEIRCILCKGSKYPPLLPKPTVAVIPFSLPFCEMSSDKGRLEEENKRCAMTHKRLEDLLKEGYDIDSEYNSMERKWMDIMLKMFALATRTDREYRALDIAELMPNTTILQGAIKYATQRHRIALAERLGEVMNKKLLAQENEVEIDPFAEYESLNMPQHSNFSPSLRLKNPENDVILKPKPLSRGKLVPSTFVDSDDSMLDVTNNCENEESVSLLQKTPTTFTNPFKANSKPKRNESETTDIDVRLDNSMKTLNNKSKPTTPFTKTSQASNKKTPETKNDNQTKLTGFQAEQKLKAFGFQLFLDDYKKTLQSSSDSEVNDAEVVKTAMKLYKELSPSEKQKYLPQKNEENSPSATNGSSEEKLDDSIEGESEDLLVTSSENGVKRKDNSETVDDAPKPKKLKISLNGKISDPSIRKLTQYAFTKRAK